MSKLGDQFKDTHIVAWPTMGFLAADWIEAHCCVPSGIYYRQPLRFDGWQLWCAANHYRVRDRVTPYDSMGRPRGGTAFTYRRSLVVGPQKCGKSPWAAAMLLFEAVGPAEFTGWAQGGEVYSCVDNGCDCGFQYWYEPGEPMGGVRPTSLIQILAYSEDQGDNVYAAMQTMVRFGPLADQIAVREGFLRTRNYGKVEPVTSRAESRLGQPLNVALGDEAGLYVGKLARCWNTMRRGVAGMNGRAIETTNPWDLMEMSSARRTWESQAKDIFKYYNKPPANLSYASKRDRHRIHAHVYADAPWAVVKAIDAEADEMVETDPTQAERFFGNRLVQGKGSYLTEEIVYGRVVVREPSRRICLGFDGSESRDWTAIRAEDATKLRFTPEYVVGGDIRPTWWNPELWPDSRIPRSEVRTAVAHLFANYDVERMYCDPREWRTEIEQWALDYGSNRVIMWPTNSITRMHQALVRYHSDLREGATWHLEDEIYMAHALNARMVAKPGDRYLLGKPGEDLKIDDLIADILAHEAACDSRAEGWTNEVAPVLSFGFN